MFHDFDELKFDIPDNYDSSLMIFRQAAEQYAKFIDDGVMQAVEKVGFDIDKDKLASILQQDKSRYSDAYKKGYTDGYLKRENEIVRCKDCKYRYNPLFCVIAVVSEFMHKQNVFEQKGSDEWYCADGRRKEDDEE